MYCSGCGQVLAAGQPNCPNCGRMSGFEAPMAGSWLPLARIERQVNALAVGWLVYSGLAAFFGLIGLAFVHASTGGQMGDLGSLCCRIVHPMAGLLWVKFAWMALSLRVGLGLAAGIGLMQKTTWGRWVAIVAGFLAILHFPFGTAMGIWTLVVLLKAPNAAGYEAMAR